VASFVIQIELCEGKLIMICRKIAFA